MQRVTNCIVTSGEKVLLLQKPRRGWWVAPGGKMEPGESIKEAVTREYREETGLLVKNPILKGIFTIVIVNNDGIENEWMLFTFEASQTDGEMLEQSPEGRLQWMNMEDVYGLPMAEGDRFIFEHVLKAKSEEPLIGTFHYTPDFQLVSYRLEPKPEKGN